jgi:hypothetical protein
MTGAGPATAGAAPAPPTPSPVPVVVGPYRLDGLGAVSGVLAGRLLAGEGAHVLVVDVTPAALGPVRISATLRGGSLGIELSGGTDGARDALRAALGDLASTLAAAGLDAGVSVTEQTAQSGPDARGPDTRDPGGPGSDAPDSRPRDPGARDPGDRDGTAPVGDHGRGRPGDPDSATAPLLAAARAGRDATGPRLDVRV